MCLYLKKWSGLASGSVVGLFVAGVEVGMFILKIVAFGRASGGGTHGLGLWIVGLNLVFLVSFKMNFFQCLRVLVESV